jgi:CHAT domain-containing protein
MNLEFNFEDVDLSPGHLQDSAFLSHLWDKIAKPILESLKIAIPSPGSSLPRIWWIPTGPLGRFPFHAAGRHSAAVIDSVMDRVVSSYSSSIKGLLEARKRPSKIPQPREDRALLVGMSITPGCSDLPFAIEEVRNIKRIFEDRGFRCRVLHNAKALKQNVLEHLKSCDIFHFAGHAMEDASDPLRSTLLLHDKGSAPMMVEDLLEVNLSEKSPYLAFLAACKTGSITATQFQDESIHLVAAYQLAGFRHVIGSLWSVEDQVSMNVAEGMYMGLLPAMTEDRVSRSLHAATRNLRAHARALHGVENDITSRDIILVEDDGMSLRGEEGNWVPFIHFGI